MALEDQFVGLDIGTTKVCAVIAEYNDDGKLDVLGVGRSVSTGLRKGVVINIEATLRSVAQAIEAAEQMAGREVEGLYTSIAGAHIEGLNSRGVVAVANRGREIQPVDVSRVIEAAKAVVLPMDREIIHVVPQEFIVDGQGGIRDPLDMIGVRLESEVHIITGSVTAAQNLVKCVNRAGFKVDGLALGALASAEAVMSQDEKDMGTLLIDIGGGTADLMLYRDGAPFYTNVVPLGGNQVTSDISILLRTPFESAERLKLQAGCCYAALIEEYDAPALLPGMGLRIPVEVDRAQLCSYIQPRMTEIFTMIKQKLEREAQVRSWQALGGGVILTGGCAQLSGAVELAQEIFGSSARIGVPYGLGGLVQEYQKADMAAAVGLVKHAAASWVTVPDSGNIKEKKTRKAGVGFKNLLRNFFE